MTYRLAEKGDIDAICDLIASAVAEMEGKGIFQWDGVYPTREDFLEDIEKENLFVGTSDCGILVVFAISKECDEQYKNGAWKYPEGDFRVIHRLCVDPAHQNRGIGKRTLEHIEREMRRIGVSSIRLDVFRENPFALSLYRNSGYEEVGTAQWRKGCFLLMEKRL